MSIEGIESLKGEKYNHCAFCCDYKIPENEESCTCCECLSSDSFNIIDGDTL